MDKKRFEIIYHLLFFAYFFGDSDLLQSGGGGATSNFHNSDYIYITPHFGYKLQKSF